MDELRYTLGLSGFSNYFRLQNDDSWRSCLHSSKLRDSDFCTSKAGIIIEEREVHKGGIIIEGKKYEVESELGIDFSDYLDNKHLSFVSHVFRRSPPVIPSFDQFNSVISEGDDSEYNILVLSVDGFFELITPEDDRFLNKSPYIVSMDVACCSGRGYVGEMAADDISYMNRVYSLFMQDWLVHVAEGVTGLCLENSGKDLECVLSSINVIIDNWSPQF